jgi:CheY-like chemotaxis protein
MPTQTILIAEDDENDRLLINRAFQKVGQTEPLQFVENGQTAIDYLSGSGDYSDRAKYPFPSVVMLDLKMPLKNGFEVLQWIRNQPRYKKMVVVLFTSSNQPSDIETAYELGVNSYLVKPLNFDEVFGLARQIREYWLVANRASSIS